MSTLVQALANAALSQAGVRFVDRNEQSTFFTYETVHARAMGMACALRDLGVKPKDVVAIILPTSLAFYDAFMGAIMLGAVPVALYPPMRLGRMEAYHAQTAASLRTAGAVVVLTDDRIRRLMGQTMELARPALGCVVVQPALGKAFAPPVVCADDTAFLQFSSGTTSDPKAIALTHKQVLANMVAIAQRIYLDAPLPTGVQQHTAVSWLPLYHDMGLVGCMLTALYEQTTLTLIGPELFVTHPAIWLKTLSRYRATVSAAPNFAYSLCTSKIRPEHLKGVDLSAWQVALNGAESVAPETIAAFTERFAPYGFRPKSMTPVYGLAEAALGVTFASPKHGPCITTFNAETLERTGQAIPDPLGLALVAVGTPLDGYAIRIVNDAGNNLPEGHKGHLQVQGPSVTLQYVGASHPETLPLAEGWLATGDVGFIFAGALYVVGRHKDLIVVRGRNIAPQRIEQSLNAIPGVRSGCVVAVSHRPEGHDTEVLILLVERRAAHAAKDEDAMVHAINAQVMATCQLKPETVVVCAPGTLPRTSSGKLKRQAALSAYLANHLTQPEDVSWWKLGVAMLRSHAAMKRAQSGPAP